MKTHMSITDKNGNEFYVIPAAEYQPQSSKKDTFLAVVGAIAITLFFVTFITRTARKLFTFSSGLGDGYPSGE